MIQNNRNQALQEWLAQSPYITDLYFNFAPTEQGVTSVASISGETVLKRYMGGWALKEYDFGVVQYKPINTNVPNNSDRAEIFIVTLNPFRMTFHDPPWIRIL